MPQMDDNSGVQIYWRNGWTKRYTRSQQKSSEISSKKDLSNRERSIVECEKINKRSQYQNKLEN